ncbi:MAG: cyclic nucleotide-binding domain-containing protein [Bosea sp. (in: a-proteobacteria)]|uniref:cyclic nucleotide-binding domain-containing protein n=1 Tax=Bosea sp. (in: a-proteobacteria) TaxID=1871050 RepID=UPI003F7B8997
MKSESPALKRLPVFAALTSQQRREIASAASLSSLAKGECVFREAEPVSNAFLILSGHVKLSRGGWHRNSVTLKIAHPGEPFGMTGDLSGHQAGRQEEDGVWVDFPVTRQEIAALTGTTLHSASRILT